MAKKSKTVAQEPWRPNFRNSERLPDIKVVRTDFLLNLIAAFVALALLGLMAYREYEAADLASRTSDLQGRIRSLNKEDKEHNAASQAFAREMQQVQEASKFLASPVNPVHYLLEVAELQPPQGVLTSFDFIPVSIERGKGKKATVETFHRIIIKGYMYPAPDKTPTQLIYEFQQGIRDMPAVEGRLRSAELQSAERDPDFDRFVYSIQLELATPGASK